MREDRRERDSGKTVDKWKIIKKISETSNKSGDKLIELMERHNAINLQQITEKDAAAFIEEMEEKMGYKPKIITGRVNGTGWPIDGHVLYFSMWDYDNRESWHLYGWQDEDGEAVMQTIFTTETETGLCNYNTLEDFAEAWKAGKWEPQASFCLPLDKVEVVEVKQEESTNDTREQLRAHGFDLTPRKQTDKGGILCLPLDKNLNGDTQAAHPDWTPIECPNCGRKCWKMPEADKMVETQGVKLLCTECAVKAGLLTPFSSRQKGKNRAQRRAAKKGGRRHGR